MQQPPSTADVLQALREASQRLVGKTVKHPPVKQFVDTSISIAERRAKRRMRKALDKSG
jgi:hypothetical protein